MGLMMGGYRMLLKVSFLFFMFNVCFGDYRKTETIREYVYDFSLSGGVSNTFLNLSNVTTGTKPLPLYTTVEDVILKVITPLSPSNGVSITLGISNNRDGFLSAKNISEFTDNAVIVGDGDLIFDSTNKLKKSMIVSGSTDREIGLTISSGNSITGGKFLIKVKSYLFGED